MNKNNWIVLLILCIWFVISFVTNILGPMLPMIIDSFGLSLTLAAFLPFSFFLAYGIMSIPAGMIIERFGGKISLLVAFSLTFLGAGLFVMFPTYPIVLTSLFAIGLGMAMLQVIILPLMREAGGEKKYAFNQVLAQIVFGAASFMSPFVLAGLMRKLTGEDSANDFFIRFLKGITPESLPWSSLYFIFTIVFVIMLVVISYVKFPKVELKEDEKAGTVQNYKELLKQKQVIFYFLGIIAYVGTEQGLANWMSLFLNMYHGVSPEGAGATTVAWFWGLMSIGCLLGLVIVKLIDSKLMIAICIILPIVDLLVLHSALLLFFVVVIDAVMIVLLPKKQTAYEYVFVDGQIDFDAIYGGEQRVNIQKIDLEKVDIVAPEQSHALDSYQQIPLKDCSSGFDKDRHYIAVYRGDDGNSVRVRFTPDETLLNNMKAKARSKIQS